MLLSKAASTLTGIFSVFIMFLGVGYIVKAPTPDLDTKDKMDLSFLRTIRPSDLNERERQKPKKPPKVEKQPDIPKPTVAKISKPNPSKMNMKSMPLDLALDIGDGAYVGGVSSGSTGMSDTDLVPIVKVQPQYPREAAMKGLEGYVQLTVDIQTDGSVANPRIVGSNPRRVFDRAAVAAARKYKYKPPVVDGKPQVVKNHGIQIDFSLDGN